MFAHLDLASIAGFIAHLEARVLPSAALLVHPSALLLATILQVVWVDIDMALQGATVAAGRLPVTVVGTGFITAGDPP